MSRSTFKEMRLAVSDGLVAFQAALEEASHDDSVTVAMLFRELESICKESAEAYEKLSAVTPKKGGN